MMKKLAACLASSFLACSVVSVQGQNSFIDVPQNCWYVEAVEYVSQNGLMSGESDLLFSPDKTLSRAMLATILHRLDGRPVVQSQAGFRDVLAGQWYSDAINWANENKIMTGYDIQRFGLNDPCSREQLATVLYRYAGLPETSSAEPFADQNLISDYAQKAALWARASGIITGKEGNRFDPSSAALRAEAAAIFQRYLQWLPGDQPETNPDPEPAPDPRPQPNPDPQPVQPEPDEKDILVSYFSATSHTKGVAEKLAGLLGADLFEIEASDPYTSQDLAYYSGGRCDQENKDDSARPEIASRVENMDYYETIFLGYPIWFGKAPKIIYTFVESYDLNGKTIVPFCTSGSSPIGSSAKALEPLAKGALFLTGQRFSPSVGESELQQWISSLNL